MRLPAVLRVVAQRLVRRSDGSPAAMELDVHIDVGEIKRAAREEARARHHDQLPDGFRFYFRRYGAQGGGRWRGVGPGGWVEAEDRQRALDETWWMVAAHDADEEARARG